MEGSTEFPKMYFPVFTCHRPPMYHNVMNDLLLTADTAYGFSCRGEVGISYFMTALNRKSCIRFLCA